MIARSTPATNNGEAVEMLSLGTMRRESPPTVGGKSLLFASVAVLVFISRIPFLGPGYGIQPDAWRVALTAHSIATTGEYSVSRFPGYPVQEIVSALLGGAPWVLNGMTALLSAIGSAFFALSLRAVGCKNPRIGSLALAFTPIVYMYSTMSLDSVWALAFILSSLYFVLGRQSILAGVLLGVAIGCRMTSGAMLIPFALLLAHTQPKREALRDVLGFSVAAAVIGGIAFAPVVATYGSSFFTFYETMGYPPWRDVLRLATLEIWGSLGFLGLLVAIVSLAFKPTALRAMRFRTDSDRGVQSLAWVVAIALYAIAYLRLPHSAKYLIPVLPFVILLLDRILARRVFVVVCSMFIASSFVTIGRSGVHPGPILSDHAARQHDMEFVERVIARADGLQEKAAIVVGAWLPKINGVLLGQPHGMADYVYTLNASELRRRLADSPVYYLPEIREYNRAAAGIDLANAGAKPLPDDGELRLR
jgi:hypothetical protein